MIDVRQRPPFLEEALHPVAERRHVLHRARADDVAFRAQHQRRGQVLLDGDHIALLIVGAIDNGEPASTDLLVDPVVQ